MAKHKALLDDLLEKRDEYRNQLAKAKFVVKGKELPLENNRMGNYRWYLYPWQENTPIRTLLMWVQEIPPGSRSGKVRTAGGRMHYVWQGRGYTIIDDTRYDWEQGDIVLIPLHPGKGNVHQHFNADPDKPVKLLVAEPNWYDVLGVDMGVQGGFEILEDSPDYKP
jgi:gentisate 1,2-dioxygenase